MPQQLRQRSGAAALFVAAAPLLLADAAVAAPEPDPVVPETAARVVFTGGGVLGVACGATPAVWSVSVPAESTVQVVNNTGRRAHLSIDGAVQGELADGASTEVIIYRGPVSLGLRPRCVLAEHSSVTVEVTEGSAERPVRVPESPLAPQPHLSPTDPPVPTDSPAPTAGATRRDVPPVPQPDAPPAPQPTVPAVGPSVAADASPGVPEVEAFDEWSPVYVAEAPDTRPLAAEPLAAIDPVPERGSNGLLALVATVCVIGVSAGAIRAILAQRASRAPRA